MNHFAAEADYDRWEVPHRAFHQALIHHAGDRLSAKLAELSDHGERYRRYYTVNEPKSGQRGAKEHRAILDSVKHHDVKASTATLVTHLSHTAFAVIEMVDSAYEPRLLNSIVQDLLGGTDDRSAVQAERSRNGGRNRRVS
jgi:DNA-binding GntR family transcriptional regulator